MRRLFYTCLFLLIASTSHVSAQNVFDVNDPDRIFTTSNRPPIPPVYNNIYKWGHSVKVNWNPYSYGYKSYIYKNMAFRLKFPKTYQQGVADGKKYPVYIFLHGAGEPGDVWDNELHLVHGGQTHAINVNNGNFDGFLLYPQSQNPFPTGLMTRVVELIDSLAKYAKADIDRVTLGGLSSGATSVFQYLTGNPQSWAAITPISSAALDVDSVKNFLSVPVWISNGGQDRNPPPSSVTRIVDKYKELGGDIKQNFYPTRGHDVWNSFWASPGYFAYLTNAHKAQPVVKFQHSEWCPGETIRTVMILQPGFYQYEWQKDNVTIPGADKDSLVATEMGVYRARFKRTSTSDWSDWSPRPIEIKTKEPTITPPIAIEGLQSGVLPAPDGSTTVSLAVPEGYETYEWRNAVDNTLIGDSNVVVVPVGEYKVRVTERFGCSSDFSAPFRVIAANGTNIPDPASDLTALPEGNSSIHIYWNNNPSPQFNETLFEVYRSKTSGTNYQLVAKVPADSLSLPDDHLEPNTTYYYVVRAINDHGAAALSNEASAKTFSDVTPPTVPANLRVTGATRHSVMLAWEESSDDIGIKNYEVFVNNERAFVTSNTNFEVSGLDSFTNYSFYVVAVDMSGNKSGSTPQVNAFTKRNGLNYAIYLGTWDLLPNFSLLTPEITGVYKNISLSVSPFKDYFGMVWEGWINIPTTGKYAFYLTSDDGSKMYLDNHYAQGITPFISNDGLHGAVEKSDSVDLSAGWHKLAVTFFEKNGGEVLSLQWKMPGGSKQAIPDMYFADSETPSGTVPGRPTGLSATASTYNLAGLTWVDNSSSETGFEIYRKGGPDADFVIIGRTDANVVSYHDSTVSGGTAYTYRVQAVNEAGVSGFDASATVTTPAAPPVPGVPQNLIVTALSPTAVNISFSGSGHTGFEIQRSIGNDHQFRSYRSIATTDNDISISDTALFGNTVVYYKVKALGESGNSNFTAAQSVTTLNSIPRIAELGTRYVYYAGSSVIPVVATDADGDVLVLTASNLPSFATFTPTENGKGNLTFNTQASDLGSYTIGLTVADAFGGTDQKTLQLIVSANRPPVFGRVREIDATEGQVVFKTISAVDPDRRAVLKYSLSGAPAFVTGRQIDNSFSLNLSPGFGDAGQSEFTLIANDGNGGIDSTIVRINVAKARYGAKVYMNIYSSGPAPAAPWNNLTTSNTSNLKDEVGVETNVGILFTPSSFSRSSLGTSTGNQSGIFPDEVMRDNFYFGSTGLPDTVYFTLNGLNVDKRYMLTVFASSSFSGGTTVYQLGGQSKLIKVRDNVSNKITFGGLIPAPDGTILVKMFKGDTTPIGYLNALVLQEVFDDGTKPKTPANFRAEAGADGNVVLKWTDLAYNADGYTVLRSDAIDGVYSVVGADEIFGGDSTYTDTSVNGNTNYYYKLFAYNIHGTSDTVTAHAWTPNKLPVLQNIADVFMKAGTTRTIEVISADSDGEILTLNVTGLPSFATFDVTGNGTGVITIHSTADDKGLYPGIKVSSTDNFGGVSSLMFDISVTESGLRTVRINFTGTAGAPYNNFVGNPNQYTTMTNLLDEMNNPTSIAFKFLTALGKSFYGMVDGDDGIVPDAILSTAVSTTATAMQQMQFSGLDVGKKYNIGILSSYNSGQISSATFTAGGKTVEVNGRYNTNKIVYLNNLTPSPTGVIVVNFTKSSASSQFLLNAVKLEEYDDGTLLSPANVMAEPLVDEKSVLLNWSDRSDSETGYEVYRSTDPAAGFVLIATTAANVSTYTDDASSLNAGTTYYYRVKTKDAVSTSEFSQVAKFHLAASKALINLNIPGLEGPAPWNNISSASGAEGDGIKNLKNTSDVGTGADFTITKHFSARGYDGVLSGVLPPTVMQSDFFTDAGLVSEVTFSGLDLRKVYRIGIMNSVDKVGQYFGNYTINEVMKQINGHNNDSKIIYFNDIAPDENGEISMSITPQSGWSPYCFTNAFTLESYTKTNDELPGQGFFGNAHTMAEVVPDALVKRTGEAKTRALQLLRMTAYPNPFVSQFKVEIDLPAHATIATLEMYDIHSRLIFKKDVGDKSGLGGRKTLTLPVVKELAPGVYTLKLTVNNEFKTFKLIKAN